ncbi:MAG: carbohydrate-binding family 9-like protein [Cyclobacteriaceae bacterium]|nr:carbohydrate-binding family 9-like protein [Cyclobacteriaceae bacterium]
MKYSVLFRASWMLLIIFYGFSFSFAQDEAAYVKKCKDFEVDGQGTHEIWNTADWMDIPQRRISGTTYSTRVKMMYSETGIYFLFENEDAKITSTLTEDFADLWEEDVVEVFFWTDENYAFYFEYELSPANYELPILVPNVEGSFLGWRPWNYEGERKTRHATSIQKKGKKITGWTAEFFIPFALLKPMSNVPPRPGTKWRVNMYRLDYDHEESSAWAWKPVTTNFHDYKNFGTIIFQDEETK